MSPSCPSAPEPTQAYFDSLVPPSAEEFDRIAGVQSRHEESNRPSPHDDNDAASLIQRTYRGYRVRREARGLNISASTRWVDAVRDAQFREAAKPVPTGGGTHLQGSITSPSGSSTARLNWKKASTIARRAGGDADGESDASCSDSSSCPSSSSSSPSSPSPSSPSAQRKRTAQRREVAKTMGLQYFLEMVDLKHRHGSRLRAYHQEWKRSATDENFFYWLDYGAGRHLDLDACPRDRLERERVRYLSREERRCYLVAVDRRGLLCWAKDGAPVDTTTAKWRDSVRGIVPVDDPTPPFRRQPSEQGGLEPTSKISPHALASAVSSATATMLDKLPASLQRSSAGGADTWIFVADTSFRLYVGIKDTGAFQHSSFLRGGRVCAAGLIRVRDGRLVSLSPLSGHYRPPASSFRAFVQSLRDRGVDMSHISVSRSYAVLAGMEAYAEARRQAKEAVRALARRRDRIVDPEDVRRRDEEDRDKTESAAREREVLEGENAAR